MSWKVQSRSSPLSVAFLYNGIESFCSVKIILFQGFFSGDNSIFNLRLLWTSYQILMMHLYIGLSVLLFLDRIILLNEVTVNIALRKDKQTSHINISMSLLNTKNKTSTTNPLISDRTASRFISLPDFFECSSIFQSHNGRLVGLTAVLTWMYLH